MSTLSPKCFTFLMKTELRLCQKLIIKDADSESEGRIADKRTEHCAS